jgi:hypothetical protein
LGYVPKLSHSHHPSQQKTKNVCYSDLELLGIGLSPSSKSRAPKIEKREAKFLKISFHEAEGKALKMGLAPK